MLFPMLLGHLSKPFSLHQVDRMVHVFFYFVLFKKKGGGNLGWVDGLQLSTYHIPELVHPESVAVVTIVSLHIVFSDFINILLPNQSPENTSIYYKSRRTTGRIGS